MAKNLIYKRYQNPLKGALQISIVGKIIQTNKQTNQIGHSSGENQPL